VVTATKALLPPRVDVWFSRGSWHAGWSRFDPDDDIEHVLASVEPETFELVSSGISPRAAILAADRPVPAVWREHTLPDAVARLDALAHIEDESWRGRRARMKTVR